MKHFLAILLSFFLLQSNAQTKHFKWAVEGAVADSSADALDLAVYCIDTSLIQAKSGFSTFTKSMPIVWGYAVNTITDDTVDFEILIDTLVKNIGNNASNANVSYTALIDNSITIDSTDSLMDLNTTIYTGGPSNNPPATSLYNVVGVKFYFFEFGTRTNSILSSGSGGTPKAINIGLGSPSMGAIGVTNLAGSEFYTIDNLASSNAPGFEVVDSCGEIEVVDVSTGNHVDTAFMRFHDEDIHLPSLDSAHVNSTYPFDKEDKLIYHTFTHGDSCLGSIGDGNLKTNGSTFNVVLEAMNSFSIRRRDVAKKNNNNGSATTKSGVQSSIGFYVVDDPDNPVDFDALPVEVVEFKASRKDGNRAFVEWITGSELNNKGFEVQYSIDGYKYKTVKFVKGQGTSSNTEYYSCDFSLPYGNQKYFIRLNQIDYNGESSFIGPVRLKYEAPAEIVVFPNPTSNAFVITSSQDIETLSLYNLQGKQVLVDFTPSERGITVLTETLDEGVYILRSLGASKLIFVRR
ncbi:MAG: T9SS type A sorting domain-containing protein [Bacteroidia bacterium]